MRTTPLCTAGLLLVALPVVASTQPAAAAVSQQTTFTSVAAEGSGCPAGSTLTSISDDGLVFTTTFSAYEASIQPGVATTSRECTFTIKVHTPEKRSVTLRSFAASGYAFSEEGVRSTYDATYTLAGRPVTPASAPRTPFAGPHDAGFAIIDTMPTGDAAWSPCGTDHELVISTSVTLENPGGDGSGYLDVSSFDGSAEAESRLQERPCSPTTAPGGGKTATGSPGGKPVPVRVQPRFTG